MIENREEENLMERYLLGASPPDEAARLEERSLSDYDFFEHMLVVENRLIDDYLAGRLGPSQRAQFEQSFLASPKRHERVEFARSLPDAIARMPTLDVTPTPEFFAAPVRRKLAVEKSSWSERLRTFFGFNNPVFGLTTAALLLLVFASWSFLENRRARQELANLNRERAVLRQREQELLAALNSRQQQTEEQRRELDRVHAENEALKAAELKLQQTLPQSTVSAIASLVLVPAGLRGAPSDKTPQLTIPAKADSAQLTLLFDRELLPKILESFQTVRAELSRGGQVEWRQQGLKPRRARNGQAFVLTLPADALNDGNYQIRLFAYGAAGEQLIADYQFVVEKQ